MGNIDLKKLLNLKRLITIAGAALAFLATVEVCARVDDYLRYDAPFTGRYSSDNLRSVKDGISVNVPLATFEKWHNNSCGFRGSEVSPAKAAGKTRVMCLGASESYGLFEGAGKEWPAQLQQLLPPSEYEVINASVVGLTLDKYSRYFDKYLAPFKPDVVVLVVNPLFYVSIQEKAATKASATAPEAPEKKTAPSAGVQLPELRCLPKAKQALKQGVVASFPSLLTRWQFHSLQNQVKEIERQRLRGRKPKDVIPASYLVSFHRDLAATVAAIQAQGARVVLTTYPALIGSDNLDKYPEIFLDNRRFCIALTERGMLDAFERFNAATASVAEELGLPLVDSHALIPKSTEYFGDNVHYKDSGARVFAEGVAAGLRRGATAASPTTRETAAMLRENRP